MFIDPATTLMAALKLEPEYSAKEAAQLLRRSYSWLDQGLRTGLFVLPDGRRVEPRRSAGGYRRFTLDMLEDILVCSYTHGRLSVEELTVRLSGLAVVKEAYRGVGTPHLHDPRSAHGTYTSRGFPYVPHLNSGPGPVRTAMEHPGASPAI